MLRSRGELVEMATFLMSCYITALMLRMMVPLKAKVTMRFKTSFCQISTFDVLMSLQCIIFYPILIEKSVSTCILQAMKFYLFLMRLCSKEHTTGQNSPCVIQKDMKAMGFQRS